MTTEHTEISLDDALRVVRKDYWDDVRNVADDLAQDYRNHEFADRDSFMEAIENAVENTQRVIYTGQAQLGLYCSDNSDAYVEEMGEAPLQGDAINWSAMMFYAMRADVIDTLRSDGIDVNDDPPQEGDEDEDEDEDDEPDE